MTTEIKAHPLLAAALLATLPVMAPAAMLSVSAERANIRSGPGTQYKILWNLDKYEPLRTVNKSGSWYEVRDFEDEVGWIHEGLLTDTPSVVVKAKAANIRSGPGMDNDILWEVGLGYLFQVDAVDGRWVGVSDGDEIEGWIHRSLVWGSLRLEEKEDGDQLDDRIRS